MGVNVLLRDCRALATLAVPLVLTQLAQVALTTTDTVMMGLLGTRELAAGGLALVLFNQLRTMGVGLVTAVGNHTAAAAARAGAASRDATGDIRAIVRAGMAVATLAGIAGAVLMAAVGQCLPLLGQDADVAHRARAVLLALAPGLLPCLWFQAVRQFTVGMRRPRALLRITLASVAVNAALNWAFVHGAGGLPRLGLTGIGVATSLVHLLSFAALYASARRDAELAPLLSANPLRAGRGEVRRLLALGTPIAATYGSEAGFFSLTALMAGSFGSAALAAHTAVNQLVYIVFQVAVGLSHAASVNVSRELALGDVPAARRLRNTALACAATVMTVVGAGYLAFPALFLRPFLGAGDDAALSVATRLLAVVAVLQFFDCAQNIGVGLLRGLDDTKGGFRLTLVGYWLVGLPAVLLFGYAAGLHVLGIWLGLLTGLASTAALLLRRYDAGLRTHRTRIIGFQESN